MIRNRYKNRFKNLIFFLFFVHAASLFAHIVEITVLDADLQIPLEGAAVRNWDGAESICDSNGKAVLSVPDDRPVVIRAAYPGYENGRIVVSINSSSYTLELRLSGVLENRELVIEATRPGTSESQTGRSVAVSGREIAQTGEIGIIEDIMTTIKLLPGVGYTGFFNAQPSIRGGYPGDMGASLDGYFITNPYHWSGGFSIFDPKMIQSARLSHGVFSTRYGHTISGLLDLTAKKPSPTETEFELGLNTSAVNFSLSLPLSGRGGLLFMGRVTYYDPVILAAQHITQSIELLNSITVAPYIRSGTITANYRFTDNLELKATGFWGMDGAGAGFYNGPYIGYEYTSTSTIDFLWTNYQGFLTAGLSWNPRSDMLVTLSLGTGYEDTVVQGDMQNHITGREYKKTTANERYYSLIEKNKQFKQFYDFDTQSLIDETDTSFNAQGRLDYDWETGNGFIAAAGIQEMFTKYSARGTQFIQTEKWLSRMKPEEQKDIFTELGIGGTSPADIAAQDLLKEYLRISYPVDYPPNAGNSLFTTSGYLLTEYSSRNNFINAELGLRLDHYYLLGTGFSLQSQPALNPRFNIDFNILKNAGFIESFAVSAGSGLFSSMNTNVMIAEEQYNIPELKPNRSWTSVLGMKLTLPGSIAVTVEGYYKHIFDRMYVPITLDIGSFDVLPKFNGTGRAWGVDIMLQKMQSRYWDGWISYSYNWTQYRDPDIGRADMGIDTGFNAGDWYFPSFHRFHTLNLVLSVKPTRNFSIYARFGIASGVPLVKRTVAHPESYPVYLYDPDTPASDHYFIEKFYWFSALDGNNRITPSLPLDVKFSILGSNKAGKTRYEVYVAVENILALVYSSTGNTGYNQYTGREEFGSSTASYDIPIPIPSFGFKLSY